MSFVKVIAIQKLQDEKEKGDKKVEEKGEELPKLESVRRYLTLPVPIPGEERKRKST